MVSKKRDRETNEKLLAGDKIILLQIKQTKCVLSWSLCFQPEHSSYWRITCLMHLILIFLSVLVI